MKSIVARFALRWFACSSGLWIAAWLFGTSIEYGTNLGVLIVGGLLLACVNAIIRPIVVILSLPAILLTLGLFMVVVNGLMVYLVSQVYPPLHVMNFWAAMGAGLVIGLLNYLVSAILEKRNK